MERSGRITRGDVLLERATVGARGRRKRSFVFPSPNFPGFFGAKFRSARHASPFYNNLDFDGKKIGKRKTSLFYDVARLGWEASCTAGEWSSASPCSFHTDLRVQKRWVKKERPAPSSEPQRKGVTSLLKPRST